MSNHVNILMLLSLLFWGCDGGEDDSSPLLVNACLTWRANRLPWQIVSPDCICWRQQENRLRLCLTKQGNEYWGHRQQNCPLTYFVYSRFWTVSLTPFHRSQLNSVLQLFTCSLQPFITDTVHVQLNVIIGFVCNLKSDHFAQVDIAAKGTEATHHVVALSSFCLLYERLFESVILFLEFVLLQLCFLPCCKYLK